MPIYEYQCENCGYQFEQMQKISENSLIKCPSCGEDGLKKLVSATAFHLKGSGWYKTDYASSSSTAAATSSNGSVAASSGASSSETSTTNTSAPEVKTETKKVESSTASTTTSNASTKTD